MAFTSGLFLISYPFQGAPGSVWPTYAMLLPRETRDK